MPNGQKVIVACSSCAAQYNVSTLQPGARFKCQKCGTVNTVPVPAPVHTGEAHGAPVGARPDLARRQAAPIRPQPRPTVKMPAVGAKPPTTIRPPVKGMGMKTSGLRKGLPVRKTSDDFDEEGMNGMEVKKKSKTPLFIGIGIGVVILVVIIIALSSDGEKEDVALKDANKKENAESEVAKEADKKAEIDKKIAEEKPVEEKPAPEMRKTAPEVKKKSSKPKINDDIDEAIKAEIEPILKDIKNQRDVDPSKEKIMAKGKKAIPIMIEAIGGDDGDAAKYAYEILLKLTKRNKDETQQVNQMLSKDMRRDCQKDWEDWWFANKESIPD